MNYSGRIRLPFFVCWCLSTIAFLFGLSYWKDGQKGDDLAAVIAAALFCVAVKYLFQGFKAKDQRDDELAIEQGNGVFISGV